MRTLPSLNFLTPTTPHKSCQSGKLENPNLGPCTPNILQQLCACQGLRAQLEVKINRSTAVQTALPDEHLSSNCNTLLQDAPAMQQHSSHTEWQRVTASYAHACAASVPAVRPHFQLQRHARQLHSTTTACIIRTCMCCFGTSVGPHFQLQCRARQVHSTTTAHIT